MKNKVAAVLLSFLIAFGLWLYVINDVQQETTNTIHNVPVVFVNENALTTRNLMITDGTDQTVTLTLTGKRSEVNGLTNLNVSVQVDLSQIYDPGEQTVGYTVVYPNDISGDGIRYETDQSRLELTIEDRLEKKVPVKVVTSGTVGEWFIADNANAAELDTKTVTVTGPASVVSQMEQAVIQVDLQDQTESIDQDYEYVLCDANGEIVEVPNVDQVRTDVEQIHVSLTILRYKELTLDLDVIDGGGATRETATILLDNSSIMISGSDELLESMGDTMVLGTIDLSEIHEETKLTFPVTLPEEVNNLTNVTEVNVLVSFPKLVTKVFTVTNIQPVNVPEGMISTVVTQQIKVTVRGPRSEVLRMDATDITVTVDFDDMVVGSTMNKNPEVTFSDAYPSVGALSWDKVVITLEEPVTEPTEPSGASDPTEPDA